MLSGLSNDSDWVTYNDFIFFQGEDPFVLDAKEDTSSDLSDPEDDKMENDE